MKKMYGLTHTLDDVPIVREARSVKIGIGLPKGRALHVWIDDDGSWYIQSGNNTKRVATREEAKEAYEAVKGSAPERKYPERLSYFTFSNVSGDGVFEPDFEAIEQHGPKPREIDVVFLKDEPFDYSYQMWTAAELKCEGDGRDARRVATLPTPGDIEQRAAAGAAMAAGEKHFKIIDGCRMFECPYSQGDAGKSAPCKPHGRLAFQLVKTPRLGTTAYFDTTGFRSVSQIFSSLQIFREMSGHGDPELGRVAGIPFMMVLRPYRVTFNGRPGTQYGVALEFRAKDALAVKGELIGHATAYQAVGLLPSSTAEAIDITTSEEIVEELEAHTPPPPSAAAMASEFYPERDTDEYENGSDGEASSVGPRMPVRRSAQQPEPVVQPVAAAQVRQEPASGDGQGYLEALEAREWLCLKPQKVMMMQRIKVFLQAGGTVDQVKQILVNEFSVESPAQLSAKQIVKAMPVLQRIAPTQPAQPVQPARSEPEPTKREMNQAAIAAQAPAGREPSRRALFE